MVVRQLVQAQVPEDSNVVAGPQEVHCARCPAQAALGHSQLQLGQTSGRRWRGQQQAEINCPALTLTASCQQRQAEQRLRLRPQAARAPAAPPAAPLW